MDASYVPSADIAWASSPCNDLSLAGKRGGLVDGPESRAFFGFIDVIEKMGGRAPRATYACVNLGEAWAPPEIRGRSILLDADIDAALDWLLAEKG